MYDVIVPSLPLSESGSGWRFASDLMDQPLKVLCELGGWKTAKALRTAGFCYREQFSKLAV